MVRQLFGWNTARLGLLVVLAVGLVQVSAASTGVHTNATGQARVGEAAAKLASLPLQAQSVISATLGSGRAAHAATRTAGGYRLQGGGVTAMFSRAGLKVGANGGSLSMRLAGVGRDARIASPGSARPIGHGNRVTYAYPGVEEWYAAGPLGIEQGFTVTRRPAGAGVPLTLMLELGGSLQARQAGSQLQFAGSSGRVALRYGGLVALDANRHRLSSSLVLDGGSLRLEVDDAHARYPLWIDPFIQQGPKLTGSGETGQGRFGAGAALSADGNTALVGGNSDNGFVGAAWVFTRTGGVWTQQGPKLTGSGETGAGQFGYSVALSADGNTALIGGPFDTVGAAWVFTRTAGVWTQQGAKLVGTGGGGGGNAGISVALSADGNTALVGAPTDAAAVGAAWVFTRTAGVWTQQGPKLTGAGESSDGRFGGGVALSADGNTALVGGPTDSGSAGAAWVFTRSAGVWTQQGAKLTGSGGVGANLGHSAALSADGNTALVGGLNDSGSVGAAWVFTRTAGVWTQQGAKLTGSGESGAGQFGYSVTLAGDGNTALVGGPTDTGGGIGAAWVFTRTAGVWTQQGAKLTGSGETGNGRFGFSADLSTDGSTALIGGNLDTANVGAAWVFVVPAVTCASPTITGAGVVVGTAGNDVIVGSPGADTILGLGGNDVICGGLGNDTIDGGADNDIVFGDEGTGSPTAPGGGDTIQGGAGTDTLNGEGGVDFVQGGANDDGLDGGAGNDTMNGGEGNDTLYGGLGADTLEGNNGNDSVNGGLQPTQNVGGGPGVDPAPGVVDICGGGAGTDTTNGSCEVTGLIP